MYCPSVGVVVGSFELPTFVELQLRAIRCYVGNVPALVVDDGSRSVNQVGESCKRWGADFCSNRFRIGHNGGDLSVFYYGLRWAKKSGLQYLCKLSTRMVWYAEGWLQDAAILLESEDGHVLGVPFPETSDHLPVHTHCLLMDVGKFHATGAMDELMPRKLGWSLEFFLSDWLAKHFGETVTRWEHLCRRYTGEDSKPWGYLWHDSANVHKYRELATRLGVDLEPFDTLSNGRFRPGYVHG